MRKAPILAIVAAACLLPATAQADPPPWAPAHGWRDHQDGGDRGRDWDDRDRDGGPRRERAYAERPLGPRDRIWRGNDGNYHCRRSDGTTGLIVGAAVGGLVGRALDDGRDRTLGTVLGLTGGALLGRAIDRGNLRCR